MTLITPRPFVKKATSVLKRQFRLGGSMEKIADKVKPTEVKVGDSTTYKYYLNNWGPNLAPQKATIDFEDMRFYMDGNPSDKIISILEFKNCPPINDFFKTFEERIEKLNTNSLKLEHPHNPSLSDLINGYEHNIAYTDYKYLPEAFANIDALKGRKVKALVGLGNDSHVYLLDNNKTLKISLCENFNHKFVVGIEPPVFAKGFVNIYTPGRRKYVSYCVQPFLKNSKVKPISLEEIQALQAKTKAAGYALQDVSRYFKDASSQQRKFIEAEAEHESYILVYGPHSGDITVHYPFQYGYWNGKFYVIDPKCICKV